MRINSFASDWRTFRKSSVAEIPNGIIVNFTPQHNIAPLGHQVFLNGLLQEQDSDYTLTVNDLIVSSINFINAPQSGDKLGFFGSTLGF
jgi:hypothetical protein